MKKQRVILTTLAVVFLLMAGHANAVLIGTWDWTASSTREGLSSSLDIDVDIGPFPNSYTIFDDLLVSSADVGTEFIATSATEVEWGSIVSTITQGLNDEIYMKFGIPGGEPPSGNGTYESTAFGLESELRPDFYGHDISAFGLEVIVLDITEDSPSGSTTYDAHMKFNVYEGSYPQTSIPDAPTLFLLGSACLLGFSGFRRKLRK